LSVILYLPILFFWYLDGFFLRTERMYRGIYKWVIEHRPQTDAYLYDLNTFTRTVDGDTTKIPIEKVSKMMMSQTLLGFYLIPLLFVTALVAYQFAQ